MKIHHILLIDSNKSTTIIERPTIKRSREQRDTRTLDDIEPIDHFMRSDDDIEIILIQELTQRIHTKETPDTSIILLELINLH